MGEIVKVKDDSYKILKTWRKDMRNRVHKTKENKIIKKISKCIAITLIAIGIVGIVGCSKDANNDEITNTEKSTTATTAGDKDNKKTSIDISKAKFVNDGKLTVGMVIDYLPFEYYPSSGASPIGVDVDIVNAISKQLGLEVEIKDVPWDDNLFVNMGTEYDIVCSAVTITEDRLKDMIFSNSYIDSYQSVVVHKDCDAVIDSFESLVGLTVAVQKETVSSELMKEYIDNNLNIKLVENDIATDCFEQLINGEVDAVVCDSTVTEGEVARNADKLKEAYRDKSKVEHFAIAIAKDNEELKNVINKTLDKLSEEGTTQKIIKSWFGR